MSSEPTKEYLHLFNSVSGILTEIRELQFWLMTEDVRAKRLYFDGSEADSITGIDHMFNTVRSMILRFQELQTKLIKAQQEAEELYLKRTD